MSATCRSAPRTLSISGPEEQEATRGDEERPFREVKLKWRWNVGTDGQWYYWLEDDRTIKLIRDNGIEAPRADAYWKSSEIKSWNLNSRTVESGDRNCKWGTVLCRYNVDIDFQEQDIFKKPILWAIVSQKRWWWTAHWLWILVLGLRGSKDESTKWWMRIFTFAVQAKV